MSNTIEAWVSQVAGRTSIAIEDLHTGKTRTVSIKGKGTILRIAAGDRQLVEEKVSEMRLNPFRNGALIQEGGDVVKPVSPHSMSDDELAELFELDGDDFRGALSGLTEVNVRRLKVLSTERNASYNHVGAIRDYIDEAYPIGGDTQVYRDIVADQSS